MPAPALDDDLSLAERVENLPVEQLVSEPGIKALDVAVLPRAARRDVGRLRPNSGNPRLNRLSDELRAIVRSNVSWDTAHDEQFAEDVDHVDGSELAPDPDCQALVRELVDHVEHSIFPSIVRSILDEVVGPHVIAMFRAQSNARAVCQPQTPTFWLLIRYLQPLAPPDAFHPLVIDEPACMPEQRGDLAIAVAAVLAGKLNDIGGQTLLVISPRWHLALRRAMLSERRTGAALGDVKLTSNMLNTNATAGGA